MKTNVYFITSQVTVVCASPSSNMVFMFLLRAAQPQIWTPDIGT